MGILLSGVFWGSVLILLGLSVIIEHVFHINIPVFKIVFACLLIYIGIRLLLGGLGIRSFDTRMRACNFGVIEAKSGGGHDYSVVFGKGEIDLRGVTAGKDGTAVDVDCAFGKAVVRIKESQPMVIRSDTAFGASRFPDGDTAAFGSHVYRTKAFKEGSACITVKADLAFGELEVVAEK